MLTISINEVKLTKGQQFALCFAVALLQTELDDPSGALKLMRLIVGEEVFGLVKDRIEEVRSMLNTDWRTDAKFVRK